MPALDSNALLARLGRGEDTDSEYKSARGGVPSSLWESYSAMANTDGGVLLLGVEDDGRVSGVVDVAKTRKQLWDSLNNRGKVSHNLLNNDDLLTLDIEGKTVLVLQVPRASRSERPVYVGQNPLNGSYRRNYEGDYRCTDQEVKRMLADQAERGADERILSAYGLEDLDPESLRQYRNLLSAHRPDHPWLSEDEPAFLAKVRAWRRDRDSGEEGLTVAGLLMFGRYDALREALPQFHVDYREKLSENPQQRWTDRLMPDGSWESNLFQFYRRVYPRLTDDLKVPFAYQDSGDLLRTGESPVHEALRETLVNALIHADHAGVGGVVVERYADRFEFANPGLSLLSREQIFAGGVSECRNKVLQTLFTLIGSAEKAGSGVDKITRGWESQHWRAPALSEQTSPDRVHWCLHMTSLHSDNVLQDLQTCFGPRFTGLQPLAVTALVIAATERRVSNARLQQISKLHPVDISAVLQELVAGHYLVQQGRKRGTYYEIAAKYASVTGRRFPDKAPSFPDKAPSFPDKAPSFPDKAPSFPDNGAPVADGSDELSEQQLLQLTEIARLKKRLPPAQISALIMQCCEKNWLKNQQLAKYLGRSPDYLHGQFLQSLVATGQLHMLYPSSPNRSDQAYRVANPQGVADDSNYGQHDDEH